MTTGTLLIGAMDSQPEGWSGSGTKITKTINSVTYDISITSVETASAKAALGKSW